MIICHKKFSQIFLMDKNILKKIIYNINPKFNDLMIEIGPGYGIMTKFLLKYLKKIYVIEIDKYLVNFLKKNFSKNKIFIYSLNVLKFDFLDFFKKFNRKLRIIGNLPYNISSLLLLHLLKFSDFIIDQNFVLQKEFVERIIAKPGNKKFGRLSIILQLHYKIKLLFLINSNSFFPKPNVNSVMVCMKPIKSLIKYDIFFLNKILIKIFSKRRKFIYNCLKNFLNKNDFLILGINPKLRPEMLTIKQYVLLFNFFKKKNYKF